MRIQTKQAEKILEYIKKYDTICVFRHESPDYDALGSQFGMVEFLKENFPNKTILAPGFSNVVLADGLYPANDIVGDEIYSKEFLSIVLDTSNARRVSDNNYTRASKIIKIDHHPMGDYYGDVNLVRPEAAAACELIFLLLKTRPFKNYKINKECAKYLYSGLVGDTGRFQYSSTTPSTLKVAFELVNCGINFCDDVYYPMYKKPIKDFEATKYVMNHYSISPNGVAYYILDATALERLGLDPDEGKSYLHLFNYYDDIKVWVCIVEDKRANNYRASVRSRKIIINEVCGKHHGGGHAFASGCRMDNFEEIEQLIADLDDAVIEQDK